MTRNSTVVAVIVLLAVGTSAALALSAGPGATGDAPADQETTAAAPQTTTVQTAEVTFTNQTSNGTVVVVDRVVVPEGGFAVVHEAQRAADTETTTRTITTASLDTTIAGTLTAQEQAGQQYAAGAVLGNSTYLEPGVHENVRVRLDEPIEESQVLIAMVHQDTNDNQQYDFPEADSPYTVEGQPVTDWANVTVGAGATTAAGQTTTAEEAETTTEAM